MEFALRYARENAESPKEIEASMKFALPIYRGGLGLEAHVLNPDLPITAEAQQITDTRTCRGDMFFESKNLIIEYNSNLHHSTEEERVGDDKRRLALQRSGYHVEFLRHEQLKDRDALFAFAQDIASRYFKKRLRAQGIQREKNAEELYEMFKTGSLVGFRK